MMGNVLVVSYHSFIAGARSLYEQGEITLEQYAGVLRRAAARKEVRQNERYANSSRLQ